jgi:hypothetical protein
MPRPSPITNRRGTTKLYDRTREELSFDEVAADQILIGPLRLDESGSSFMSASAHTDSADLDDVRPVTI